MARSGAQSRDTESCAAPTSVAVRDPLPRQAEYVIPRRRQSTVKLNTPKSTVHSPQSTVHSPQSGPPSPATSKEPTSHHDEFRAARRACTERAGLSLPTSPCEADLAASYSRRVGGSCRRSDAPASGLHASTPATWRSGLRRWAGGRGLEAGRLEY
ncbi:hypothetical protein B2J93_9487 [Marssonina coronariae]|uniref:Uncharacterized protein n=1 Tax=Diplocarpon coronariae TaxID=2795749 RepID=A0A218YVB7_9HELO|nr:hypothetical protein B2J93_9487 [Marssonina coronariae]